MFRHIINFRNTLILFAGSVALATYHCSASEMPQSGNNYKTYSGRQVTFNFPSNWKIEADEGELFGHKIIKIGTTGISTITIEIVRLNKEEETKNLTSKQLIKNYKEIYNKAADAFGKFETEKNPVAYSDISRKNNNGLKESRNAKLFGKNVSYIKEFFLIELPEKNAFVTLDADGSEYQKLVPGFENILVSIKPLNN